MKTIDCRWATSNAPNYMQTLSELSMLSAYQSGMPITHWSRVFELPWVMRNIQAKPADHVLDVGGGDSILQFAIAPEVRAYLNLEPDAVAVAKMQASRLYRLTGRKVAYRLHTLQTFCTMPETAYFQYDKVLCVSVLEHDPDPVGCVRRLALRVLPGGRLLLTFDVASYARHNHSIDEAVATAILKELDIGRLPDHTSSDLSATFDEIAPAPHEPNYVKLKVLCVCVENS